VRGIAPTLRRLQGRGAWTGRRRSRCPRYSARPPSRADAIGSRKFSTGFDLFVVKATKPGGRVVWVDSFKGRAFLSPNTEEQNATGAFASRLLHQAASVSS
jgi:hypothetical protein